MSETALSTPGIPSWAEQDEVLREMWQRGENPNAIAVALNRSVAAIMTRAARLGLPRRFAPGRKPSRQRTSDGTNRVITAHTRAPAQVSTMPAQQLVERICLMCLTKFPSSGRHNRICAGCKDSPDYAAGSRLPDLDFPV